MIFKISDKNTLWAARRARDSLASYVRGRANSTHFANETIRTNVFNIANESMKYDPAHGNYTPKVEKMLARNAAKHAQPAKKGGVLSGLFKKKK